MWEEGQIHQAFVMGKIGEQLLFKLRPIASGDHGHFDDTEKIMQNVAISASRDDLLSASVPSRSKTMSFFIRFPSLNSCNVNEKIRPATRLASVHCDLPECNFQQVHCTARPKSARSTTAGRSHTSPFRPHTCRPRARSAPCPRCKRARAAHPRRQPKTAILRKRHSRNGSQ